MSKMTRRDAIAGMAVAGSGLVAAKTGLAQEKQATMAPKFMDYTAQTWTLDNLDGLDKEMMAQHYKLYTGYVTNVNKANAALSAMAALGNAGTYDHAEVRRRLGFEYCGMRLHEYYFGAMKAKGTAVDAKLKSAVEAVWGSWDAWKDDFIRTGTMRGIGWAILYQDPMHPRSLQNHWITDHELFHPPGFTPILVMDVWEHAYVLQFGASGRKGYIDAFMNNIDWGVVAKRLR